VSLRSVSAAKRVQRNVTQNDHQAENLLLLFVPARPNGPSGAHRYAVECFESFLVRELCSYGRNVNPEQA